MKSLKWILVMIAGLGLSAAAQQWLDAWKRTPLTVDESLYLTSGAALKRAALGFDGLLADLYWIRTVQYFGAKLEQQRATKDRFDFQELRLLEPLLEITTELDPRHVAAYRFGAFFLPEIDPEKAIDYVRQGIRNNPNEWRLDQDLGFLYWRLGRYREASEAYLRGGRLAGAPAWLEAMAATMLEKGGDRQTAREMMRRLCEVSEDEFIKQICGAHSAPRR